MAATVIINEVNGVGATKTNKTNGLIRFRANDSAAVDAANPLVIPTSGNAYSFEKYSRLEASGSFNAIENIVFYTDGGNNMGIGITVGGKPSASYSTPQLGASLTGYTDIFTYTAGSPLDLGAGPFVSAGDIGDYLVMLMEISNTSVAGNTGVEGITFQYDES